MNFYRWNIKLISSSNPFSLITSMALEVLTKFTMWQPLLRKSPIPWCLKVDILRKEAQHLLFVNKEMNPRKKITSFFSLLGSKERMKFNLYLHRLGILRREKWDYTNTKSYLSNNSNWLMRFWKKIQHFVSYWRTIFDFRTRFYKIKKEKGHQ